jgi:hypothetical protein
MSAIRRAANSGFRLSGPWQRAGVAVKQVAYLRNDHGRNLQKEDISVDMDRSVEPF